MSAKPDQLALDFAQLQAEESKADLVLSFSPDNGVLVCGATRTWKDTIKRLSFRGRGFRFSRNLPEDCAWYAPNTRGATVERAQLEQLAAELRHAGASVDVRFSSAKVPFSEREQARAARAAERIERRHGTAEKLRQKADREFNASRGAVEHIPFGQPILVGHHSERKHRRAIEKAQKRGFKGLALSREAEQVQGRAERAEKREEKRRSDPATMQRRIARLETDLRSVLRNLHGAEAKGTTLGRPPATGDYKVKLEGMRDELEAELAYWRAQLGEQVSDLGAKVWGPKDFAPGDAIQANHGLWVVVQRVNPKSLSVKAAAKHLRMLGDQKLGYDRVEGKATEGEQQLLDAIGALGKPSEQQLETELGWDTQQVRGIMIRLVRASLVSAEKDPLAGGGLVYWREAWDAAPAGAAKQKKVLSWTKTSKGYHSKERVDYKGIAHQIYIERSYSDSPWRLHLRPWNEPMTVSATLAPLHGFRKLEQAKADANSHVTNGTYPLL